MKEVRRYDLKLCSACCDAQMIETTSGHYVTFGDHDVALRETDERADRMRDAVVAAQRGRDAAVEELVKRAEKAENEARQWKSVFGRSLDDNRVVAAERVALARKIAELKALRQSYLYAAPEIADVFLERILDALANDDPLAPRWTRFAEMSSEAHDRACRIRAPHPTMDCQPERRKGRELVLDGVFHAHGHDGGPCSFGPDKRRAAKGGAR